MPSESSPDPELIQASDCSLLVRLSPEFSLEAHRRTLRLFEVLHAERISGVTSFSPAYVSLLIRFDPLQTDHERITREVDSALAAATVHSDARVREHTLPVCYDDELAPDLADLAAQTGLRRDDIVELHSSGMYRVYFMGFLPGFAYMGDLPERLAVPRRSAPRHVVPAGSVGIAGRNTGIYPVSAPGGWNLIGRCPTPLFSVLRDPTALLAPGDLVRFRPVSRSEFEALERAAG